MPRSRTAFVHSALPFATLALALALILPGIALAQDKDEAPRTITITGEGEVSAAPDIAYVETGVVTEGKTAAEALAADGYMLDEDVERAALLAQDWCRTRHDVGL